MFDETVRQELGDSIALVLSPDTAHRLTPLLGLGFSGLRQRHETIAAHGAASETRPVDRQELLHGTTSWDGQVGLS